MARGPRQSDRAEPPAAAPAARAPAAQAPTQPRFAAPAGDALSRTLARAVQERTLTTAILQRDWWSDLSDWWYGTTTPPAAETPKPKQSKKQKKSGSGSGANAGVPGHERVVAVQPVVFTGTDDDVPTGQTMAVRHATMADIWGKLGVRFEFASPIEVMDPYLKDAGGDEDELIEIMSQWEGDGVGVFWMDNALTKYKGGATVGEGPRAKIVIADRGTSKTLLAHEMGHVFGLDHPGLKNPINTIMDATSSINQNNPTRNPMDNYVRMTWPLGAPTTLYPDP